MQERVNTGSSRFSTLEGYGQAADFFLNTGKERVFARGACFLREGRTTDMTGYVAEGGFRHLAKRSECGEKIIGYSFVGDFIQAIPRSPGGVSAVSIQAVRKSTVYMLRSEDALYTHTPEFRLRMAEITLGDMFGLLLAHSGTAGERYRALLDYRPDIVNEVSLKEIASLLGMTPETLSRIRKKLAMTT